MVVRNPQWSDVGVRHATALGVAGLLLLVSGAAITGIYDTHDPATITAGYSMLALFFMIVLLLAVPEQVRRPWSTLRRALSFAPLRSVGRYSYGIYVLHLPLKLIGGHRIAGYFKNLGGPGSFLYLLCLTLLSYGMAVISYHLFESRFLALKRYVLPKEIL